jgi:hypothetical protein
MSTEENKAIVRRFLEGIFTSVIRMWWMSLPTPK